MTNAERILGELDRQDNYLALGGSLDPDVDSQCPFWSREDLEAFAKSHTNVAANSS